MFEGFRARRIERANQASLRDRQSELDDAQYLLELARGVDGPDRPAAGDLVLHAGELLVGALTNVGLIEDRSVGGHFEAGSHGISIPIGSLGGRSVRYRVGRTRGHYVAGAATPTAIDQGSLYITDQRIVFVGSKGAKECRLDKLISVHRDAGEMTIAVSNRSKATTVHYGAAVSDYVQFSVDFALARFHGEGPQFIQRLADRVTQLESAKPASN